MAGSAQFAVTTSPQQVASAPATQAVGPTGWVYITNGSGAAVFLGGPNVSSSNGAQVAASATWTGSLFPGDALYAVVASTGSTIGVLVMGA